jgi:hypothetical protein
MMVMRRYLLYLFLVMAVDISAQTGIHLATISSNKRGHQFLYYDQKCRGLDSLIQCFYCEGEQSKMVFIDRKFVMLNADRMVTIPYGDDESFQTVMLKIDSNQENLIPHTTWARVYNVQGSTIYAFNYLYRDTSGLRIWDTIIPYSKADVKSGTYELLNNTKEHLHLPYKKDSRFYFDHSGPDRYLGVIDQADGRIRMIDSVSLPRGTNYGFEGYSAIEIADGKMRYQYKMNDTLTLCTYDIHRDKLEKYNMTIKGFGYDAYWDAREVYLYRWRWRYVKVYDKVSGKEVRKIKVPGFTRWFLHLFFIRV